MKIVLICIRIKMIWIRIIAIKYTVSSQKLANSFVTLREGGDMTLGKSGKGAPL